MNRMNTASVGLAVTPTVLQTFVSHYLNRKPLHQRPTAHLSYDEGLHLIRSFLNYVSHHSVEELQAFTAQWVPHPQWIKVDQVSVPADDLDRAAVHIEAQLGPDGIRRVGGSKWWQWRKPDAVELKAEWIEMRSDYSERQKNADAGKRVMLYVHGGAYFFGSVDMHRYQMQRHARKLKARVFAPEYRLAPQFPFPCGLQDCLAAYLHLLNAHEPSSITLAGDSAGGAADAPFDYIPQSGFHHKPSPAWPPPNDDEIKELKRLALEEKQRMKAASAGKESESIPTSDDIAEAKATHLTVMIDGEMTEVKEQIQMYTTNELLTHPLVSPIMQPTLGGLPPLLIMVGGGEILRDEQIYVAHKCANPSAYLPSESTLDERARQQIKKYKPTDVQLQVWDDLCHVAPTLSFTRPAKYMYRSVAQFGAWALARAQKRDIEILDDDDISVISKSTSDSDAEETKRQDEEANQQESKGLVGKAGDALPPFKQHMIRQRVTRHGVIFPLPPASELPGCSMDRELVGVAKQGPVKTWLQHRRQWDHKFASAKRKIHKQAVKDLAVGYEGFGEGELPPPSALAGRRKKDDAVKARKRTKNMGFALWSLWGSKHDKMTMNREMQAEKDNQEVEFRPASAVDGQGARSFGDIEHQGTVKPNSAPNSPEARSRRPSRRRVVSYQRQDEEVDENGAGLQGGEGGEEEEEDVEKAAAGGLLSPGYRPGVGVGVGSSGKRAYVDGIAVPFALKKEAETASMLTLTSHMSQGGASTPRMSTSRPMSPEGEAAMEWGLTDGASNGAANGHLAQEGKGKEHEVVETKDVVPPVGSHGGGGGGDETPLAETPFETPFERPGLESFATAQENLPTIKGP